MAQSLKLHFDHLFIGSTDTEHGSVLFSISWSVLATGCRIILYYSVFQGQFQLLGELHFIVFREKNGPPTTPSSHTGTGYESQGSNIKGSSLKKQKNTTWPHLSN